MKKALSIILVGLAVTLSGCTLPWQKPVQNPAPDNIACTEEAKICPDGSAVGRQGPNCEFTACPATASGCVEKDGKCCKNSLCSSAQPNCIKGTVPVFKGCDNKCQAQVACEPSAQIANPASVNCKEKGGTSEIITAPDGSQSSICKFPDGSQCDEWEFYRGDCPQGSTPIDPRAVGPGGAPIVIPGTIK